MQIRQPKYIFIFCFLVLFSCNNFAQLLQVDNTKPMYGEVEKSKELKIIDNDYVQECLKLYGTIDSSVNFHIILAWKYYYNGDLSTAMKRFNQAWLLNPDFPDSYFGFAALMEMQKNKVEANRFYNIAFEKDSDNQRSQICFERIGDCKEKLKDLQGVITAYSKLAEIDSLNSFAFKKIGYFQMQLENFEPAIIAFNKAIKLDPSDAITYSNRGHLFKILKDYSKAIADFSKAIEIDPKYLNALVNRGLCQMEIGKFKNAKKDFENGILLDSKAFELRRFLGFVKLKLSDINGACSDFRIAKKLGDNEIDDLIEMTCK